MTVSGGGNDRDPCNAAHAPSENARTEWFVRRDHGGGWHHVCDASGIIRADVFGPENALLVCRTLAEHLGVKARPQEKDDVVPLMFSKAVREVLDA